MNEDVCFNGSTVVGLRDNDGPAQPLHDSMSQRQ